MANGTENLSASSLELSSVQKAEAEAALQNLMRQGMVIRGRDSGLPDRLRAYEAVRTQSEMPGGSDDVEIEGESEKRESLEDLLG